MRLLFLRLSLCKHTSYHKLFHYFILFIVSTISALKIGTTEKKGTCMKLQEQLEALEKETAAKLADMDQYNKDIQVRTEFTCPI